jgi:hypothetical protein
MSYIISQIVPSLKTISVLGNTTEFKKWLKDKHRLVENQKIFEGYKYAVNCCLNNFIAGIADDYQLKIKNDFLFERALRELVPLHKIENTCEKTVFLKRIKPFLKEIQRSNTLDELSAAVDSFQKNVSDPFDRIFNEFVTVKPGKIMDKFGVSKLVLLNFAHTYLIQVSNDGPTGNFFNPLSVEWTKEDKKDYFLEGYKYAIQYLWLNILGEAKFNQTSLTKLHTADSWRDYKHSEKENSDEGLLMMGREVDLENETSINSYFYRIKEEITDVLDKDNKFPTYRADEYLKFRSKGYNKKHFFEKYLSAKGLEDVFTKLSWEDKILSRLYWYPVEIVNVRESGMHLGIPSFNTMLAGTVALHNKDSEFKKIIIARFVHPHPKETWKHDYSYGILIDAQSAAGHYYSGWVIYQNACGDYSGFSGSEHQATEKLIKEYKKAGKIILRELTIPLQKFEDFTSRRTLKREAISILDQNKLIPKIIQEARAYCFELFAFYVYSTSTFYKTHFPEISLNTDKTSGKGEKDVLLKNHDEVILVECKLNADNQNINELIDKLNARLSQYQQKEKFFHLWFWYEPSTQNEMILKESGHKYIIASKPEREPLLKTVDLSRFKFIMQDYE